MKIIYEVILLLIFIILFVILGKEVSKYRIKGVYTRTYLGSLFMLLNPRKYFKKEHLVEAWFSEFIEILVIIGGVYLLTQIIKG